MYNKINSDSDILLEITSERSNDLSSVHTSNTTERSKTSSTKVFGNLHDHSSILAEITSERSKTSSTKVFGNLHDHSSVHPSNTFERSKTSSTKVFGNLHDHSSILAEILEKHCLNKLSIGYYLLDDKMIGLGLLDETHKFYTDLILGNIPLNSSNIKLPYKLEIIKPTSYVSLVLIKTIDGNIGYIWYDKPVFNESDIISNITNAKIFNIDIKKINEIILAQSTKIKIYGLQNKLLVRADMFNSLRNSSERCSSAFRSDNSTNANAPLSECIEKLKNISYYLNIWFNMNYYKIQSIYDEEKKILISDDKSLLRFNSTENNTLIYLFYNMTEMRKNKVMEITTKRSASTKKLCKGFKVPLGNDHSPILADNSKSNINNILKKYVDTSYIILKDADSSDQNELKLLNEYIKNSEFKSNKYNLLFTSNFPIYIYGN
jgi:hypothetical protein